LSIWSLKYPSFKGDDDGAVEDEDMGEIEDELDDDVKTSDSFNSLWSLYSCW
jgi:hypothetical protein